MELRHLGGEALHHGGLAPPVLVDGDHQEPQVAAGVEAGDEEDGLHVGDVGEHHPRHHVDHLQHEDLVQTSVKPGLASSKEISYNKSQAVESEEYIAIFVIMLLSKKYISSGNGVIGLTVQLILFSLSLSI